MKKLIILLFLLTFSSQLTYCQNFSAELLKSYSKNELKEIAKNTPKEIELLNYAINHACYIVEKPTAEKTFKTNADGRIFKLPIVEIENQQSLDKIKFTDLGFKIHDTNLYFLIKNSDKMLVVKSKWVLQNEIDQIK